MKKFLCLQRRVPTSTPASPPAQADMQAMFAKFNEWQTRYGAQLIDLGGRLGQGRVTTAEPVADGALVEVKSLIGGYMIVSAETLDDAVEIARACPGLVQPGSGVEVIEIHTPKG